ncbi:MAG: Bifunctional protein Aas [Chlamydiae bacterium]|nr:Bifunctional protein Aas [Chlamydiota bacterium]
MDRKISQPNWLATLALYTIYWIARFVLSLRYSIRVEGLKEINEKGILFLPNHPAEMDPVIVILLLWPKFRMRPLAVEHFYYQKGIRFFMDLVRTLPLPTMEIGNMWKARRVEKLKALISEKLKEGDSFLVYPSGKLKSTSDEKIGGASLAHDLVRECPDLPVALIRTTGLWGSSFSRALTGSSPDFGQTLWKGVKTVLKNGIFFTPRRKVRVEIAMAPKDFPRQEERIVFNKYLEKWFNERPDPLKLVSYAFWKEELAVVHASEELKATEELVEVPKEVKQCMLEQISKLTKFPVEKLELHLNLSHDLGLDSLDVSQINVFLEEQFDAEGIVPGSIQTVQDALQAAAGARKEFERAPTPHKKWTKWPKESARPGPLIPEEAATLPEAFLRTCDRMGNHIACTDRLTPLLSYKKIKRSMLVLSKVIKAMPGDRIGVMLPSSVAAYVTIGAIWLSGKVPVMLNWTAGPRNLEHAAELCELKAVISSFRFLSRLDDGDLGKVDDMLVLLEEVRYGLTLGMKLKALFWSFFGAKRLMKKWKLTQKPDDTAIIIFTSGTETLPKGVPLTHRNVLSNQRAALECVHFGCKDLLYGVLPPFHSFGFSVTGILPLIAGIKVCYAPDPTDARALIADIEHWHPTLFCCAPSFALAMMRIARKGQLSSLRLFVTGAEKAPEELFKRVRAIGPKVEQLEGYGISECSPCVTLDREGEPHRGVGKPLPGIELCTINPETGELLKRGEEGEICIKGPSIFGGYLGGIKNPFIEIEGSRWYRSGDRGYIDEEGYLIWTGRLTRFVKIGGEMISLGGIEKELIEWATAHNLPHEGAPLAVVSSGRESEKPEIILFITFEVTRQEINGFLKETGHGRLVKISEVRVVPEIPLTGAGKTHYRQLEEWVNG